MGTAHPYKRSGNIVAIDGSEQIVNLPLGELELLPCFRLAVLLALNHPVIPGEQPLLLEDRVDVRSEEHTSELQSRGHLVCRLLLEKKKVSVTTHVNGMRRLN